LQRVAHAKSSSSSRPSRRSRHFTILNQFASIYPSVRLIVPLVMLIISQTLLLQSSRQVRSVPYQTNPVYGVQGRRKSPTRLTLAATCKGVLSSDPHWLLSPALHNSHPSFSLLARAHAQEGEKRAAPSFWPLVGARWLLPARMIDTARCYTPGLRGIGSSPSSFIPPEVARRSGRRHGSLRPATW
jgi:hypothetical protein